MAEVGSRRTQPILRRADELAVVVLVSLQRRPSLVSLAAATQPAETAYLGADAPFA